MYSRDTEIRHLSSADVYKLGQILEGTYSWKKLMRIIPKDISGVQQECPSNDFNGKYNNDHIRLIENASIKQNRTCTEILFEEWGTSGRIRPTLKILLDLLIKAELFRAADFVATDLLNESPPERPLKGPAAKVDISLPLDSEEIRDVENVLENISYPGTDRLNENAYEPSNIINKDYYEKMGPIEKKVDIVYSDLIKFSSNSIHDSSQSEEIPNLSFLVQTTSNNNDLLQNCDIKDETESKNFVKIENKHSDGSIVKKLTATIETAIKDAMVSTEIPTSGQGEMIDEDDIPALSQLNSVQNSVEMGMATESIPNLSALHVSVPPEDGEVEVETEGTPKTEDSQDDDISIPSASNSLDDSCCLTPPNLSLLDQSNHNDSSLTNVTGTSDENSFASTENIPSDGNIPCLSILNN